MKIKLVSNWKDAWRWFSMNCMAASTTLLTAWVAFPDDLKKVLPLRLVVLIAVAILFSGMVGRLVHQEPPPKRKKKRSKK